MESEYKRNKIIFNLIYGYFFLGFTIVVSLMLLRKFLISPEYFNFSKIIFSFTAILLLSFLTFLFLRTSLIRKKYYQNNLKYFLELDNTNKVLIIHSEQKSISKYIHFDDVKSVELYYSWNTNPFSSDLGYSKIMLNNGDFLFATQNNINQYHIYKAFKDRISVNKSRFSNSLK